MSDKASIVKFPPLQKEEPSPRPEAKLSSTPSFPPLIDNVRSQGNVSQGTYVVPGQQENEVIEENDDTDTFDSVTLGSVNNEEASGPDSESEVPESDHSLEVGENENPENVPKHEEEKKRNPTPPTMEQKVLMLEKTTSTKEASPRKKPYSKTPNSIKTPQTVTKENSTEKLKKGHPQNRRQNNPRKKPPPSPSNKVNSKRSQKKIYRSIRRRSSVERTRRYMESIGLKGPSGPVKQVPSARVRKVIRGTKAPDIQTRKGPKKLIIPLTTAAKLRIFKKAQTDETPKKVVTKSELKKERKRNKSKVDGATPREHVQLSFPNENERIRLRSEDQKKSHLKMQKKQSSSASTISKDDNDETTVFDKANYGKILYIKSKRYQSPDPSGGKLDGNNAALEKVREHFSKTL